MLPVLSAEFSWKSFGLDHPVPLLFVSHRWQHSSGLCQWYLVHRWFWAVYHLCWCFSCIVLEGGLYAPLQRKFYYFIYLTQWSYMILTVMNVVWAFVVTQRYRKDTVPKVMDGKLKFLWLLINLSFQPAVLITIVYWLAIYDPDYPVTATNAETHIVNSVYVVIELVVSAVPVRILHFYQPLLYLTLYLTFNVIYFILGGQTPEGTHYIYPVLDWQRPAFTIPFIVFTLILTLFLQSTVWGVTVVFQRVMRTSCRPVQLQHHQHPNASQPQLDTILHV